MPNVYFQIRIYTLTFVHTMMWTLMFVFSYGEWMLHDYLRDVTGSVLIVFAVFNLICMAMFWVLIPATRKKSYDQIFSSFNFGFRD